MLTNPTSGRRTAGRLIVLATVAVVLPLTATRAINYVDVPVASADISSGAPVAAAARAAAVAQPVDPAEPAAPAQIGRRDSALNFRDDGTIVIDGQQKSWRDLTPEEKAEVRRSIAEAKEELARTRIDRAGIQREIREAMADAKIDQEELRRDLAEARVEIEQAMRQVDDHAIDIRRSGQDPETIKAQVRASLKAVEAIDVEAITRNALASVDHSQIEASVAAAEAGIAKARAEIEQLEQRLERDE